MFFLLFSDLSSVSVVSQFHLFLILFLSYVLYCYCCVFFFVYFFFVFFKKKTAYEMRISDWSSDVCSSDLHLIDGTERVEQATYRLMDPPGRDVRRGEKAERHGADDRQQRAPDGDVQRDHDLAQIVAPFVKVGREEIADERSEERSVGKACVSTCRSGGSPDKSKKKH